MRLPGKHISSWSYLFFAISLLFFISTFFFRHFSFNNESLDHQVKVLQQNLQSEVEDAKNLLNDTLLINRLANKTETLNDLKRLHQKQYFIYLFKNYLDSQYLRFWSTDLVMIPDSIISSSKTEQFAHLANGYYYTCRLNYKYDNSLSVYCVVLIKSDFFVSDNHFVQSFTLNKDLDGIADISVKPTSFRLKSLSGAESIYLKQKPGLNSGNQSGLTIYLRLISFLLVFVSLYFVAKKKYRPLQARHRALLFVTFIIIARIFLFVFSGLLELSSISLFNPQVYASSNLLPSLGDLFINSFLFCWLAIFLWRRIKNPSGLEQMKSSVNWKQGILSVLAMLVLSFVCINIIRGLITNSKISFDVTNFFSLSIYSLVGFIIIVFIGLGYLNSTRIILRILFSAFGKKEYWIYFLIILFGLAYIALFADPLTTQSNLLYLVWILAFTLLIKHEHWLQTIVRFNIPGIIFWIFIFSISISALLFAEINRAEIRQRKVYIEKLDTQTDPSTERLINIANAFLDSNFFRENFERFYNSSDNLYLRDSILTNNYARYLKTFSGNIYLYDSTNTPLFNKDSLSFESINTIVSRLSKPTDQPDLFFYETAYDKFAYITYREVKNL